MNRSASDATSGNSQWPDGRDFFESLCCPKCKTAHVGHECPTDPPVGIPPISMTTAVPTQGLPQSGEEELPSGLDPITRNELDATSQIREVFERIEINPGNGPDGWITNMPKSGALGLNPSIIVAEPKATEYFTVAELESQGIVGLWKKGKQ